MLILEVWELVRDAIPPAKRHDIAVALLKSFEEYGFEHATLADAAEEDSYMSKAFHDAFEDEWEEETEHDLDDD
jgi:hypothetical protein